MKKEKEAIQIYEYYADRVRNGGQAEAVYNILELLKGCSKEKLMKTVDMYKAEVNKDSIQTQFRLRAPNFFKKLGRAHEFLNERIKVVLKADPQCPDCLGSGKIYAQGSGLNFECFLCLKKQQQLGVQDGQDRKT